MTDKQLWELDRNNAIEQFKYWVSRVPKANTVTIDDITDQRGSSLGVRAQVASREDDCGIVTYTVVSGKKIVCDERDDVEFTRGYDDLMFNIQQMSVHRILREKIVILFQFRHREN